MGRLALSPAPPTTRVIARVSDTSCQRAHDPQVTPFHLQPDSASSELQNLLVLPSLSFPIKSHTPNLVLLLIAAYAFLRNPYYS